jgi:hypothetical protein
MRGKQRYAWCFDHARLHTFSSPDTAWTVCSAAWLTVAGSSPEEALKSKIARFGKSRFVDELPPEAAHFVISVHGRRMDAHRAR